MADLPSRHISSTFEFLALGIDRDIDGALRRFVSEPRVLREKLRDVDGIISGGFALQFMAGLKWPESDLDICVNKDKGQILVDHLVQNESYDCCSVKHGKYNWSEIETVYALLNVSDDMRTTKQIEIVLTKAEPVKSVLTECYMTALINVITYDAAYSLFPVPTFKHCQTFSLKEPDSFHNILLSRYHRRGYRGIQRLPSADEDKASEYCFSTKSRRVGDALTWKLALPLSGIAPPLVPSNIETTCFDIEHIAIPEKGREWMVLRPIS